MRVIVTGSRLLDRAGREQLRGALSSLPELTGLVVGDCPTGADFYAREWVADMVGLRAINVYVFRAAWAAHGRSAGPNRNRQMVQSGADLCLAFYQPGAGNVGTRDCVAQAQRAGIEVREYGRGAA